MARNIDQITTSSDTAYAVPRGVASAPTSVEASGRFEAIEVTWPAALAPSGCAVTVYSVEAQNVDAPTDDTVANSTGAAATPR